MIRKFVFLLVSLLLVGGGAYFYWSYARKDAAVQGKLVEAVAKQYLDQNGTEDLTALALKGINLAQGENGIELWRLKANWASVLKEGDMIEIKEPSLVYFMQPDNEELRVTSQQGTINQKSKDIQFIGDVLARTGNSTMRADLMRYDGAAKSMQLPDGARFFSPGVNGTAGNVVWDMFTKVISASGGVTVDWTDSGRDPFLGGQGIGEIPAASTSVPDGADKPSATPESTAAPEQAKPEAPAAVAPVEASQQAVAAGNQTAPAGMVQQTTPAQKQIQSQKPASAQKKAAPKANKSAANKKQSVRTRTTQ